MDVQALSWLILSLAMFITVMNVKNKKEIRGISSIQNLAPFQGNPF